MRMTMSTTEHLQKELKIFENGELGQVRAMEIEGKPYFVGKEVAQILGYTNPNEAIQDHIDDEDKLNSKMLSSLEINLGQRGGWLINESGLYSLILSSKLPTAKKFKRWVTSEVLPSIRKHGAYAKDELLDNPDLFISALQELKKEKEQRKALEQQAEQDRPKVLFADSVAASHSAILIGGLAKLLKQNGLDIGQNRLFEKLRNEGFLIKRKGLDWNTPTQRAMDMGLFEVKETVINHSDGHTSINRTVKVTGKGQIYFINRFLQKEPEEQAQ